MKEQKKKMNGKTLTKKEEFIKFLVFVAFSCSAGVIQIGSFSLMNELIGWSYWPSYLISLLLSVLWNFTINRKFTFKSANNMWLAMLLVLGFYAVFTPISTLWGDALEKAGWNEYIVLAFTMVINVVGEFLYCRYVVYSKSINTIRRKRRKILKKKIMLKRINDLSVVKEINFNKKEEFAV